MGKDPKKRRRSSSSSSSSSSNSSGSNASSPESDQEKKKKLRKLEKRLRKEQKKMEKRLREKIKEQKRKMKKRRQLERESNNSNDDGPAADIPIELMEKSKAMAPMTKEEWEKRQSVIRRVLDEETGRYRLIKGDGEVLEEIVPRERHKQINKQATQADGAFFQSQTLDKKTNI